MAKLTGKVIRIVINGFEYSPEEMEALVPSTHIVWWAVTVAFPPNAMVAPLTVGVEAETRTEAVQEVAREVEKGPGGTWLRNRATFSAERLRGIEAQSMDMMEEMLARAKKDAASKKKT